MNKLTTLLATLALGLALSPARAEDKPRTPQQNRMAQCNKEASGKTGDERKQWMKSCLSAHKDGEAAAKTKG